MRSRAHQQRQGVSRGAGGAGRVSWLLGLTALAVHLGGGRAEAAPRRVSVTLEAGAPCVSAASLTSRLGEAGLSVTGSGALLDVDVSAGSPGLRVRARHRDDGRLFVRRVPAAPDACAGVERVLAALISEWALSKPLPLRRSASSSADAGVALKTAEADEPAAADAGWTPGVVTIDDAADRAEPQVQPASLPAAPRPRSPAPAISARPPPAPAERAPAVEVRPAARGASPDAAAAHLPAVPDAPAQAPPPVGGFAPSPTPAEAAAAPEVPALMLLAAEPRAPAQGPASPAPPSWEVRLALAGGVSGGRGPSVTPAGAAVFDLGWGGPGLCVEGTLEGTATADAPPGRFSVSAQSLTATARWRWPLAQRVDVDVGVGLLGSRLAASASGFTTNGEATLFTAGPAATATVWGRLGGPFLVVFRGLAARLWPEDQLRVAGGPALTLGTWQLGGFAGLSLGWP